MWMMGYSDGGGEINTFQDPFTGRKLRPLMPRPTSAAARIHGADLFTLNHHLAMAEQSKRDIATQQVVVSSRWNPTPEQLQTLEELYRRGTRTPSADQIQHITSQLRRYGKIEGKNVFYWFQNHKARERQKRRRQLESDCSDKRDTAPGANRAVFEVEQTKNWASPTNSSTAAEKSGEAEAECKADDGWLQFDDDAELQRRRNATWRMMNLSCSSSSTNLITNSPSPPAVTVPAIPSTVAATTMQQQFIKPQDFINIFLEPYAARNPHRAADAQTLQLFPLERDNDDDDDEEPGVAMSNCASQVAPCQFFEFLPLKN